MKEILLLKLGEIVLKGLNRGNFEKRLMKNIAWRLRKLGRFHIYCLQSTIYVEPQEPCDMDAVEDAVCRVFGVVSVCRAAECEKDIDRIYDTAVRHLGDQLRYAKTFKVDAKRSDKSFPLKSPDIAREIGGRLHDAFPQLVVDVHAPEVLVKVEVRDRAAYPYWGCISSRIPTRRSARSKK